MAVARSGWLEMGRFTYDHVDWSALSNRAASLGYDLEQLTAWFGVLPAQRDLWIAGESVPVWLVVAVDVVEGVDLATFQEADLPDFLTRWEMRALTLARLLGVHPTSVKRWRSGEKKQPRYLARLLGLFDTPRGMLRARRSVSRILSEDRDKPGIPYPFKRTGAVVD